jgi:adenine-specific DNA methylase
MRFIGCKENLLDFIETFVQLKNIKGNVFCDLFSGTGSVAKHFKKLGYLDPPYNERQYAPNYHILETIAKWDNPQIKGVTGMRSYENQKSEFCNSKTGIKALGEIVNKSNFKHLILSYNDDGIMPESVKEKIYYLKSVSLDADEFDKGGVKWK